jgi:hypothetical protein
VHTSDTTHRAALASTLTLAILLSPPAALAQGESAPDNQSTEVITLVAEPWTIKFEPAVWYTATSGDIRMPGAAGSGNGLTLSVAELDLDSPRASPMGELLLRRGDWRIGLRGVGFSTDNRGSSPATGGQFGAAAFAAGDTLRSSVDLTTFAADGAYAFHTFESGTLDSGGAKVRSTLLALGGIRAIDASAETLVFSPGSSAPSGTAKGDAFHAHPYAGLGWELEIYEDFTIDLLGTMGGLSIGNAESWSTDIIVGFQWNPTPHFGAQIGYRQLLFGVERGEAPSEFAWQGGLAGVYAGATLRF